MRLKVRVDHLLLAVGGLVLVIGSLLAWRALRPDPERAELDRGLEELRDKPSNKPRTAPRLVRPRGAFSSGSTSDSAGEREGWANVEASAGDPGEVGPDQAVDEFKTVIAELEAAVDEGRKLGELEQAELYNRATGSLTALSAWVDGSNPRERALLDDAYTQMMGLMRQLDIQPPQHDPDRNPLRR